MTVSTEARDAMFAQETADGLLMLLTIDHATLSSPIRVVNNHVAVTSRSNEFVGFPFQLTLPSSDPSTPPRARLTIDNVSREIGQVIRQITSAATVLIEVVLLSDADSVELALPALSLRNVRVDAAQVTGDISSEDLELEPFPSRGFTPSYFPGLF